MIFQVPNSIYQDTAVLKFLKIAELWGLELDTDMWTIARKMAEGTRGSKNANPLLIHHVSMINSNGEHTSEGGFRNTQTTAAITYLIEKAPDYPEDIIVKGLHDICITKENFRLWCVEKYPLPKFWFTDEERQNFTHQEIEQIKRVGKIVIYSGFRGKLKNSLATNEDLIDFKPNIGGIGINLNALYRYVKKLFRK